MLAPNLATAKGWAPAAGLTRMGVAGFAAFMLRYDFSTNCLREDVGVRPSLS